MQLEHACAKARLAEVNDSLVDAQAQGQNGDAQPQLLICAVALSRPHRLQLHLRARTGHTSALQCRCHSLGPAMPYLPSASECPSKGEQTG